MEMAQLAPTLSFTGGVGQSKAVSIQFQDLQTKEHMSNPQDELKRLCCLSEMQNIKIRHYLKKQAIMEEQASQETKVLYISTGQERTGRSRIQPFDISFPTSS